MGEYMAFEKETRDFLDDVVRTLDKIKRAQWVLFTKSERKTAVTKLQDLIMGSRDHDPLVVWNALIAERDKANKNTGLLGKEGGNSYFRDQINALLKRHPICQALYDARNGLAEATPNQTNLSTQATRQVSKRTDPYQQSNPYAGLSNRTYKEKRKVLSPVILPLE